MLKFLLFLSLCSSVFSAPLTWSFVDTTLTDGGSVSGSFDYDATTNTYSNINLLSSGGSSASATFLFHSTVLTTTPNYLGVDSSNGDRTGTPSMDIFFTATGLTNAGGTVALQSVSEGICNDPGCNGFTTFRTLATGSVTAISSVPEPATLGTVGVGLLLMAAFRRRKIS